ASAHRSSVRSGVSTFKIRIRETAPLVSLRHTPHPRSRSAANVSPSMTRSTVARHVQVEVTTSTSPPQRERTSRYTSRYTSEWYVQPVFADVTRRNQRMNRVGACARYDTNTPVEVLVTDTAA